MDDKLLDIIENEKGDEIIPFLQSLPAGERKKLSDTIIKCLNHYSGYKNGKEICGSHIQFVILSVAAFVCLDYNDYKRNRLQIRYLSRGFLKFYEYSQQKTTEQIRIDDILQWFYPEWMSKFINDPHTNEALKDFSYDEIMRWSGKGYITLTPELIVATLQSHPFVHQRKGHYRIQPEKLLEYPETIREHIWLFFYYPSDIHSQMYYGLENEDDDWNKIFVLFVLEGRLERMRVLKECLLTANRDFSKPVSNWFTDLFNNLQPTEDELLILQEELLQCLNSKLDNPVHNALKHLKTICTEESFHTQTLLNALPVLSATGAKSNIMELIHISEKLLNAGSDFSEQILIHLSSGLADTDEDIQRKLAKLILKYDKRKALQPYLSTYARRLFHPVKILLADYLDGTEEEENQAEAVPETGLKPIPLLIREDNKIPEIHTFDDFLIFAAQAFDNNAPWHCFLLPMLLQKFRDKITAATIVQLEPAFKNAHRILDTWSPQVGLLDRTFAVFFMSYAKHLARKFPDSSAYLNHLVAENVSDLNAFQDSFRNCYELYPSYVILLKVLNALQNEEEFRLLATPTHTPLWLDPLVLVERIRYYQEQRLEPYHFDMQQALLRCAIDPAGKALQAARELLTGELRDLMVYLLDKEAEIPSEITHISWWMCAATSKNHHQVPKQLKEWEFDNIHEEYLTGRFKWKTEDNGYGVTVLKLKLPPFSIKTPAKHVFLLEYYYSMFRSRPLWSGDVMRIMASLPNNNDAIAVHILNEIRNYNAMDSSEKASMIHALRILLEIHRPLSDIGYLLLGLAFFAPDKTIQEAAASLWMDYVRYGMMDPVVLGKKIAELLQTKWLPLKRFTDLIEINLLHISNLHNKALEELLTSFLNHIGEKTLTHLKKLLEIYYELLSTNNSTITPDRIRGFAAWQKEGNLKKIVKQILETVSKA